MLVAGLVYDGDLPPTALAFEYVSGYSREQAFFKHLDECNVRIGFSNKLGLSDAACYSLTITATLIFCKLLIIVPIVDVGAILIIIVILK